MYLHITFLILMIVLLFCPILILLSKSPSVFLVFATLASFIACLFYISALSLQNKQTPNLEKNKKKSEIHHITSIVLVVISLVLVGFDMKYKR